MKCLVVRQPFAGRIARGEKTIELRSRITHYRGPVLILAAARPYGKLDPDGPMGVAICVVDLIDCRPATFEDKEAATILPPPDHYGWVLSNPRPVANVPTKGMLGLYAPGADLLRALGWG